MIISPPYLRPKSAHQTDKQWIEEMMPVNEKRDYPLNRIGAWHGGVHIPHTDNNSGIPEFMRAIADGEVVSFRQGSAPEKRDAAPLNYVAPTDDGYVLLKHETEIGTGEGSKIVFYSLYLHLQSVKADVVVQVGSKVYRKQPIGVNGCVDGKNESHFQIFCDDENFAKIVGRTTRKLDLTKDGRTDAVYGDIHFYLPAGTKFFDKPYGYGQAPFELTADIFNINEIPEDYAKHNHIVAVYPTQRDSYTYPDAPLDEDVRSLDITGTSSLLSKNDISYVYQNDAAASSAITGTSYFSHKGSKLAKPSSDDKPSTKLASDNTDILNRLRVYHENNFSIPEEFYMEEVPASITILKIIEEVPDHLLEKPLYVTMSFEKGNCIITVRKESEKISGQFELVGEPIYLNDYEYNLYKKAQKDYPLSPSAGHELLRFGRIINTDHETLKPADALFWMEINYPNGKGYVNLANPAIKKYSDADFPHWMGWELIDDDDDSQYGSSTTAASSNTSSTTVTSSATATTVTSSLGNVTNAGGNSTVSQTASVSSGGNITNTASSATSASVVASHVTSGGNAVSGTPAREVQGGGRSSSSVTSSSTIVNSSSAASASGASSSNSGSGVTSGATPSTVAQAAAASGGPSSGTNSQCNSAIIQKMIEDDTFQKKKNKLICHFPFEWEKSTIDQRYSWLKVGNHLDGAVDQAKFERYTDQKTKHMAIGQNYDFDDDHEEDNFLVESAAEEESDDPETKEAQEKIRKAHEKNIADDNAYLEEGYFDKEALPSGKIQDVPKKEIKVKDGFGNDISVKLMSEEQYKEFKAHAEALSFETHFGSKKMWHFQPLEFIAHFRKCTWLSEEEMLQMLNVSRIMNVIKERDIPKMMFMYSKERTALINRLNEPSAKKNREINRPANIQIELQRVLRKYLLTTPLRIAHFLGQAIQETRNFEEFLERGDNAYFLQYEVGTKTGKRLGNTQIGDGVRFKGRGAIQLTGRDNYQHYNDYRFGKTLKKSEKNQKFYRYYYFSEDPHSKEIAENAYYSIDASAWYWIKYPSKSMNYFADQGSTVDVTSQVTHCINAGRLGLENRWHYFCHSYYLLNDELLDSYIERLKQVAKP